MARAVCTDIQYVEPGGCCRSRMVFRSVWDRLCQQLFGAIPPGMDTEDILPDITIWQEGVILQEEEGGVFSFTVTTSGEEAPKAQDVILYKGIYYIIGQVGDDDDETPQAGTNTNEQAPTGSDEVSDPNSQQVPDDVLPSGVSDGTGSDEQTSTNTGEQVSDPSGDNTVPHIENPIGNSDSSRDDGNGSDDGRDDLFGRTF